MNLCVSGQLYDPTNVALNNPLGPGYSSESDQVVYTSQAEYLSYAMNPGQVMYHGPRMYRIQAMYPRPLPYPCQVLDTGEAMELVNPPVPTLATREKSPI